MKFDIEWTHIGGEKTAVSEILKFADSILKDRKNIKYIFKGYLSNDDFNEYYKQEPIDCFINVSFSEGVPVSIMEALSFGIPVIATNVGGVSELVNSSNGFLLSPNPSIEEISSAIQKYRDLDQSDKLLFRKNAYDTWDRSYNAEKNYRMFADQLFKL